MKSGGEFMIIPPKDAVKLFGVFIMCACAVLICTLFLNSNIDMARIKEQISDPETMILYELTVSSGNMTSAVTGGALALTTVVMLLFYVKHYIDTHMPELGILKALGYSNMKIAKVFWAFSLLSILYGYRKLRQPALELIRGKSKVVIRKQKAGRITDAPFLSDLKRGTVRSRFRAWLRVSIWFDADDADPVFQQ
jgi:hypothetical protein